jgi:hypothetical protein
MKAVGQRAPAAIGAERVTTPHAVESALPRACSACGGSLDALGRCAQCGAVYGEAQRCPLCQAVSDVEESKLLYYRCRACGGPRIPPTAGPTSERETALLAQARSEQLRAGAYRVGSGFALASGLMSLFVTNVVLLATSPPAFARTAALLASAVPLLLALVAFRRAARHRKKLELILEQAWLSAAERVCRAAGGAPSTAALAQALRIDEPRAELLLAELSLENADLTASEGEPVQAAKVRLADLTEVGEGALEERSKAELGAHKP